MTGGGIDIDRTIRRIAAAETRGARGVLVIALLCVSAAIAIRLLLAPLFGDSAAFMTFVPAVIVAALWGGRSTGVLALLLCVPAGWITALLPDPEGFRLVEQAPATVAFLFAGGFTALVAGSLGASVRALHEKVEEAEQARSRLSETEIELRAMVDQAAAGIAKCDLNGRIVSANGRFCEIIGRSEAEVVGSTTAPFTHPEDVGPSAETIAAAQSDAGESRVEKRYVRPDGSVVWCLATARVATDAMGKPEWVMAVIVDITEAKSTEAALRESEARFRDIADTAPVMIWVTARDRQREFVNQAYVDFTADDYDSALITDWRERLHPDDHDRIVQESIAGETSARPFALEARYRRRDGAWRWLRSFSRPRLGPEGEVAGFVGVAFDVTEPREAAARLAETETRFRMVADSAPVHIWMCGEDGRITFGNRRYRAFFGVNLDTGLIGAGGAMMAPNDRDSVTRVFERAFAARDRFEATIRVQHPVMGERWLRCEGVPRFDAEGRFQGYVGANFDVSDSKKAEDDLKNINELLEERVGLALTEKARAEADLLHAQRLEAVGRLTGGVAHDFNNLLTVVIGALDIVQRAPDGAKRAKLIDAALSAARRGERLTHQLLAFSRRQTLRPEETDLNHLIREGEPLLRQAVGETIALKLKLRRGGAPALVDPGQFEAALINLLVNARDAIKDGGHVTIETQRCILAAGELAGVAPGRYVCVRVIDDGMGMDAATIERIFEPFFTTKGVGKGTGLGLSQVYGFARQTGGGVKVESAPGEGTRITLYLPQLRRIARRDVETADASGAAPADGGRLLLVEDDPAVSEVAESLLLEMGMDVTTAASGPQAIQRLEADSFDIMLSDVVMPGGMTGIELAAAAHDRWPAMRIILASGYAGDDVDSALAASPWPFLKKPYSAAELARILQVRIPD
ncbi:PAS domain S-box protein [Brevundimonas sp.]|uniref:PAS domain S-box protein n=1 Tax=Brevundimonas sp. TaxID=1871086 RepID=UPI0035AE5963